MKLEIRRLSPAERDRIRRAILADMEEREDLCCTRREWIAAAFDDLRKDTLRGLWSFDCLVGAMLSGPRIRRRNRENQERLAREGAA